ncbi:MAG: hypothetical protein RL662_2174 [Bacteroidota bacterium]|jgi:hypothetical protein
MKVKFLVLLGVASIPLVSNGQTFYNKGKMSIVSTDTTKTVLYVKGDFVVGGDATSVSEIYLSKSKTVITGDFIQNASPVSGSANVFAGYQPDGTGYIAGSNSKFVFAGVAPQHITTALTPYSAVRKGATYINFPDIEVLNNKHVTVSPEVAVSVQNLKLTKGKLILDSRRMAAGDVVDGSAVNATNSTLIAHLNVAPGTNKISYNRGLTGTTLASLNDLGVVEVKLALDDPASFDGTPASERTRSIVGMGSPFETIRADYFMWNFLMFPYDNNIIGRLNTAETDPTVAINAGRGFVLGVDLRGTAEANYPTHDDYTGSNLNFAARNTDNIVFNRFAFANNNNIYPITSITGLGNSGFATQTVTSDSYAKENLVYNDVKDIPLENGFNYLANPFTAPLSLKRLLDEGGSAASNPWKVAPNVQGGARDIMNRVWILNPSSKASGLYRLDTGAALGKDRLHVTYSYNLMQNLGGTYTSSNDNGSGDAYTIAPLQMFVIYVPNSGTLKKITIPASERAISAGTHFLRSSSTPVVAGDDFLFEVVDAKTKIYDRTAVVIRTPEDIMSKTAYSNTLKLMSNVVSDGTTKSVLETKTQEGVVTQSTNSIIYTKDAEGKDLESLFLAAPEGEPNVSTSLYLAPSVTNQEVVIRAKRLNTMGRVSSIWLEDKLTGKSFELSTGKDYVTSVKSTDKADRFNLKFVFATSSGGSGNILVGEQKTISSHYTNNTLTITGFEDSDLGSKISVYDIQGRMLKQATVNSLTERISATFAPGAYIVKVVGSKSHVSKFLVR